MNNEAKIAWCAALFEGEGSISIRKADNQVTLSLGMTDRDVVERFRDWVGVGTVYSSRSASFKPHHKTRHQWVVGKREDVMAMLDLFLPWFGERRATRAGEAIAILASRYRVCFCGKEFMPHRPEHLFCSRNCKSVGRIFRTAHT